jgi:mannose-6-phosphate isomerase-like protein (cupin superfamily)
MEAVEGEILEDPIQHYRFRFSGDDRILVVEMWADPGGGGVVRHVHPNHEERFEVLEGEITFVVHHKEIRAGPGDRTVAAAGVPHAFRNTGRDVAHLIAEVEPPLELQQVLEQSAALGKAGRFSRPGRPKGITGTLEGAEFLDRYRETFLMASPPRFVQRILVPPVARIARWRRRRGSGKERETEGEARVSSRTEPG